jgi:hypothetical protein
LGTTTGKAPPDFALDYLKGMEEKTTCFTVDLLDLKTGKKIGKGTDCLSNIKMDKKGGLTLTGTTFFDVKGRGKLVTRGKTTVQPAPTIHPAKKGSGMHITGALSHPLKNDVLHASGDLKGYSKAKSRLSGIVKMTDGGKKIDFDCLFHVVPME